MANYDQIFFGCFNNDSLPNVSLDPQAAVRLKKTMSECLCYCALSFVAILTGRVLPCFSDEWESNEDDDEGEWMDVHHSSDEEQEVQSVYGFFVFVQFGIVICRYVR